jgi:hypothetical protein
VQPATTGWKIPMVQRIVLGCSCQTFACLHHQS